MTKSVFSIATNVTSGSEDKETDNDKAMDGAPGVTIDGMDMVDKEEKSLIDNMNRATATLQLGSSESASKEGGQGDTESVSDEGGQGDDTNNIYYQTESDN